MWDKRTHHVHLAIVGKSALNVEWHLGDIGSIVQHKELEDSEQTSEDLEGQITDLWDLRDFISNCLVALIDSLGQDAMMHAHEFHYNRQTSYLSEEVLNLFHRHHLRCLHCLHFKCFMTHVHQRCLWSILNMSSSPHIEPDIHEIWVIAWIIKHTVIVVMTEYFFYFLKQLVQISHDAEFPALHCVCVTSFDCR